MARPSIPPIHSRFSSRAAMSWIAALAVLGLGVPGGRSQSAPEFEAASVKLHASGGSPHVSIAGDPGLLTLTNITVRGRIREAYGLKIYPPLRGPDPLSTDQYDVIAKVAPDASKEQRMLMLLSRSSTAPLACAPFAPYRASRNPLRDARSRYFPRAIADSLKLSSPSETASDAPNSVSPKADGADELKSTPPLFSDP